jgi:hypothetical protein
MKNNCLIQRILRFVSQLGLDPPRYLDLSSEIPTPTTRSRTGLSLIKYSLNMNMYIEYSCLLSIASPSINSLNRAIAQNTSAYSPGPNMSTPPTSSGPSPDRILTGPSSFDASAGYHRSNSYANPGNPNTFLDISPSSSTSSPHRSTSIDTYIPPMETNQFNEYSQQPAQLPPPAPPPLPPPPPPPHSHQFQPPGMMYRGGPNAGPAPGAYFNPHASRYYAPDQQHQQCMYPNQRMMIHPQQQHPPWAGHRPPLPPSSHMMHYNPYEHHQYRMASSQQFCHPIMSDQNSMFLNQQQQQQQQQQQTVNSSASNKLSSSGEPHPHPLQSLERLVLLPESQVMRVQI